MLLSRFRMLMQLGSSVLSNGYVAAAATKAVNTNPLKGVCVPFLNCYACPTALFSCPIGTLQHFAAIRVVPFLLLGFLGLVGLTVGRMACGWVCPFGFLQDLMYKIRSRKYKVALWLRFAKYGFLAIFVLVLPYATGVNWFSRICPAGALTAGLPWVLWGPLNPATGQPVLPVAPGPQYFAVLALLLGFLVWFVVSKRPFCKAVCPLGAIFALFNRFSLVRLEVAEGCDGCHFCQDDCPMDLAVPLEMNSGECIRCLECTRCGHVKLTTPFSGGGVFDGKRARVVE